MTIRLRLAGFALLITSVALLPTACSRKSGFNATSAVPAETIVFLHLPDIARTKARWPLTALAKIGAEPEVKAFMEKPKAQAGELPDAWIKKLEAVDVREAFVAATSFDGNQPKVIAGFSYRGKKEAVDAILADAKKATQAQSPDGKSDIVQHGKATIETFVTSKMTLAATDINGWYFIATDLDLIKQTLDVVEGKPLKNPLSASENYKKSMTRVPSDADTMFFLQPATLIEKLKVLATLSGEKTDGQQWQELAKIRALTGATKLDGANMRDVLFVLSPGMTQAEKLTGNMTSLTTPDTVLFAAIRGAAPKESLSQTLGSSPTQAQALTMIDTQLAAYGLKLDDLTETLDWEGALSLDWEAASAQPSLIVALGIKDRVKASKAFDALQVVLGASGWERKDKGEVGLLLAPTAGMMPVQPALGLGEKHLFFALTADTILSAADRIKVGGDSVEKTPAWAPAMKLVGKSDNGIGFIDLKRMFERTYDTLKPALMMFAGFVPAIAEKVDISKLPATETIAKHLGPVSMSQTIVEDGVLSESVGPITFNQATMVVAAGIGAAAAPALQQMKGLSIPGMGGFSAPAQNAPDFTPPAAPAEPTPAEPAPEVATPQE